MYKIMKIHSQKPQEKDMKLDEEVRKVRWDELVCILEELERTHGWKQVDGTEYYTKDDDPSHKSMVLGK